MSRERWRDSVRDWLRTPDGQMRRRPFALVALLGYLLFTVTYVPINLLSAGRRAYTLFLPGEERLPFLPVFEYLYLLTFFVGPLLVLTVREYPQFVRLMRALAIALGLAYTTYLIFPVYFERPTLHVDSLHTWLLSLKYRDGPYNHFPSLHVTLSWIAVQAVQVPARRRRLLMGLAVGVSVSTIFVKQHYIVDVLAGGVLAWFAWRMARPTHAPH